MSWSRGTSWGSTPAIAGMPAAVDVPLTAASAARCQISAVSVMTRAAIASALSPEPTLVAWMTRVRPNRSASTPPASRNTTIGMLYAARTVPRAVADPLTSRTANDNAMPAIVVPAWSISRDSQ